MAQAQGRILDPKMCLRTDPRINPRLLAAITPFRLGELTPDPPIDLSAPFSELVKFAEQANSGGDMFYSMIPVDLPIDSSLPDVSYNITECPGPDGNTIKLHVYRPSASTDVPLPCVVYIHGGAMVLASTSNKVHNRWMKSLAATGLVVIGIDFRNAWTAAGLNPFPAGLNDCVTAVKYIKKNQSQFNFSKLVLQGESGGANLSIATALKANREGWIDAIDGVYASVPYISGAYGWNEEKKLAELPSLVECDAYFVQSKGSALLAKIYDPEGKNATNPLAWPYYAEEKDLKGLPPFVISVNELDPLRDEGVAFWRKLVRAGVRAVGKINLGLIHGAEMVFRQGVPEDHFAAISDINRFAGSL